MATSGTSVFSVTRDQVVQAALRLLKVIGEGETPSTEMTNNASEALNIMIKSWVKRGAFLPAIRYALIPMVSGVHLYPVGPTAGYVYSGTVTNAGSGGTPGTYALGLTGGGGTGATGTYTIGADGTVTEIAITAGGAAYISAPALSFPLGSVVGAAGVATIVGLTTHRPLRILEAFLRDNVSNIDIPLILLSRNEYNQLGSKSNSARPNQFYYAPQLGNGQLYVFPQPGTSDNVTIHATAQVQFEDMSASSDEFSFPQENFRALKFNLAVEIGPEYISDMNRLMWLQTVAEAELQQCFDWSQEEASVYFTVAQQ